jgi:hypothetical protein
MATSFAVDPSGTADGGGGIDRAPATHAQGKGRRVRHGAEPEPLKSKHTGAIRSSVNSASTLDCHSFVSRTPGLPLSRSNSPDASLSRKQTNKNIRSEPSMWARSGRAVTRVRDGAGRLLSPS